MSLGDRWCELDAAIHTFVMKGGRVVGEAVCMAPEGPPWVVCPGYDVDKAEACNETGVRTIDGWTVRPVAIEEGYDPANDADDPGPWKFGVPDYRLDVVPAYSGDIAEAWKVAEKVGCGVQPHGFREENGSRVPDGWEAWVLSWGQQCHTTVAPTAAEAICRAALKAIAAVVA